MLDKNLILKTITTIKNNEFKFLIGTERAGRDLVLEVADSQRYDGLKNGTATLRLKLEKELADFTAECNMAAEDKGRAMVIDCILSQEIISYPEVKKEVDDLIRVTEISYSGKEAGAEIVEILLVNEESCPDNLLSFIFWVNYHKKEVEKLERPDIPKEFQQSMVDFYNLLAATLTLIASEGN